MLQRTEVDREPKLRFSRIKAYFAPLIFAPNIECREGFLVGVARKFRGRAHMTALVRTKQAQFEVSDCIPSMNWTYENIVEGIRTCSHKVGIDIISLPPAFCPILYNAYNVIFI